MPLIEQNLEKIEQIVSQYSDERKAYNRILETITEHLETIIDRLAKNTPLISKNSVRELKYYRFSTRVKEVNSLKEKFVRGNLLQSFEDISVESLKSNDGESIALVKKKIAEIDDLIGIKILTDLIRDCEFMFEIINSSDFKSLAKSYNIELNEDDLMRQPVKMKNGLPIYKISGVYENKNPFELQIKSKLISAWGDMEHAIFYKDYAISPVRDTAQKSMNHVGQLLLDIDKFVESIRNADKDYAKNANALLFIDWMTKNYNERISNKLNGISFNISGISEVTYALRNHLNIDNTQVNRELRFDHFSLQTQSGFINSYINTRNKVFELQILEAVVLSWLHEDTVTINEQNVENILNGFLENIRDASAKYLALEIPGKDEDEISGIINNFQEVGLQYSCDEKFLLNLKKNQSLIKLTSSIDDFREIYADESNFTQNLKKAIFISINNGNVIEFIESIGYEIDARAQFIAEMNKLNDQLKDNLENETYLQLSKELNRINKTIS